jgi:hypothetical protein
MDKRWHGKEGRWGDRVRVNIPVQVSANALSAHGWMKKEVARVVRTDFPL